jgi:hypothetical protein
MVRDARQPVKIINLQWHFDFVLRRQALEEVSLARHNYLLIVALYLHRLPWQVINFDVLLKLQKERESRLGEDPVVNAQPKRLEHQLFFADVILN